MQTSNKGFAVHQAQLRGSQDLMASHPNGFVAAKPQQTFLLDLPSEIRQLILEYSVEYRRCGPCHWGLAALLCGQAQKALPLR